MNLATSDDSSATDPAQEECRLQCPSAGQDKEETYTVSETPITEG